MSPFYSFRGQGFALFLPLFYTGTSKFVWHHNKSEYISNVTWTEKLLARQTNRRTDTMDRQKGVSVSREHRAPGTETGDKASWSWQLRQTDTVIHFKHELMRCTLGHFKKKLYFGFSGKMDQCNQLLEKTFCPKIVFFLSPPGPNTFPNKDQNHENQCKTITLDWNVLWRPKVNPSELHF